MPEADYSAIACIDAGIQPATQQLVCGTDALHRPPCVMKASCALSKGHSQVEEMISKLLQNKAQHSAARLCQAVHWYTNTLGATGADGVQGEDVW